MPVTESSTEDAATIVAGNRFISGAAKTVKGKSAPSVAVRWSVGRDLTCNKVNNNRSAVLYSEHRK